VVIRSPVVHQRQESTVGREVASQCIRAVVKGGTSAKTDIERLKYRKTQRGKLGEVKAARPNDISAGVMEKGT